MDAATRQMLADLGMDRRDELSAPGATNDREAATIRAREQTRRERMIAGAAPNGGGSGGGGQADMLRMWNTTEAFDRDDVAERMEDRWSGQAHRAAITGISGNRRAPSGGYGGPPLARMGAADRSRAHTQALANRASNVGAQDTPFTSLLHRGTASRTQQSSRDPARPRAPSPRAAGTTRFGPDGTRQLLTPGGPRPSDLHAGRRAAAAMHAITGPTKKTHAAAPPVNIPANVPASMMKSMHAPQQSPAAPPQSENFGRLTPPPITPKQATQAAKSAAPAVLPTRAANISTPAAPTTAPAPSHNTARPTATPVAAVVTPFLAQLYRNTALWHAANPGPETNAHYEKYPDRKSYFTDARNELIRESLELVKKADESEIKVYLETHKERKWMLDAASKTKEQIENDHSADEIARYAASHPRQKAFMQCAQAGNMFSTKPKAKGAITTAPAPAPQVARTPAPQPNEAVAQPLHHERTPELSPQSSSSSMNSRVSVETNLSTPDRATTGSLTFAMATRPGGPTTPLTTPLAIPISVTLSIAPTDPRPSYNMTEVLRIYHDMAFALEALRTKAPVVVGARLASDDLWEEDGAGRKVVAGARLGDDGLWAEEDPIQF